MPPAASPRLFDCPSVFPAHPGAGNAPRVHQPGHAGLAWPRRYPPASHLVRQPHGGNGHTQESFNGKPRDAHSKPRDLLHPPRGPGPSVEGRPLTDNPTPSPQPPRYCPRAPETTTPAPAGPITPNQPQPTQRLTPPHRHNPPHKHQGGPRPRPSSRPSRGRNVGSCSLACSSQATDARPGTGGEPSTGARQSSGLNSHRFDILEPWCTVSVCRCEFLLGVFLSLCPCSRFGGTAFS